MLPPFARDFKLQILATRPDSSILVRAMRTPAEFDAETDFSKYEEAINHQPGWRFDAFILGVDSSVLAPNRDAEEPTDPEILRWLDDAKRLLQAGFLPQARLTAWAALEAVLRHQVRLTGREAEWGTSPQSLLTELVSNTGAFSITVFYELERILRICNEIAHGFHAQEVEPSIVEFVIETTRKLMAEAVTAVPAA